MVAARVSSRRHRLVRNMQPADWILVGMMGVGKSTVGQVLATESGREFVDTDRLLVQRFGRPVPQIFQIYGETTFRDHEASILKGLERSGKVVSTGGGIVLREENWESMRRLGVTIFLSVPLEVLTERLRNSKKRRPLLQTDDFEGRVEQILADRMHLYRKADVIVELGEATAGAAAELVLNGLREHGDLP